MEERGQSRAAATGEHVARAGAGSPTDSPLERIRGELAAIRASLGALEHELARLEEEPAARRPVRARSDRYYQLLIEVYERGPHGVSADELDELARHHRYDRRGLNGYFAGLRAPFRRNGDRIQLTLEGHRLVHDRLEREATG
jgi:hypothetical protein